MKKTFFLLALALTQLSFYPAEINEVEINWKQSLRLGQNNYSLYNLGNNGSGQVLITKNLRGYKLKLLDVNSNVIKELDIDLKIDKVEYYLEDAFIFNGNIILFKAFRDEKELKYTISYQIVDYKSFALKSELKHLATLSFDEKAHWKTFEFVTSTNGKYLCMTWDRSPKKQVEGYGDYLFKVYDEQFNILHESDVSFDREMKIFSPKFHVSNRGDVFITSKHYISEKGNGNKISSAYLSAYYKSGKSIVKMVNLDFGVPEKVEIMLDGDSIVLGGLYRDEDEVGTKGYFLRKLGYSDLSQGNGKYERFGEDFLDQSWPYYYYTSEGGKTKTNIQNRAFSYNVRFFRPGNRICMVTEQTFTFTMYSHDFTRTSNSVNEVIAFDFNNNLSLNWKTKLGIKLSNAGEDGVSNSYFAFVYDEDIHFLYNLGAAILYDEETFKKLKRKEKHYIHLCSSVLKRDGSFNLTSDFVDNKYEIHLDPASCRLVSKGSVDIYTDKYRRGPNTEVSFVSFGKFEVK